MSSKEQLLRNIEELSANIERQKIFLLQLEASRSDARRALNALCSPIARLPVETLSHIFTLCMPFSKDELESLEPDPLSVPLLLLHICHLWRDIALFTPAFWASIHFKRPQF
ncbi:hypothetical protein R3P38DRAFT_2867183 [Favolaschia claudopus]|uniref:F-box domain-containing protein n=1 Tax=Favolaschia claudopus TaxID=2862362 RepID=A0AAW0DAM9_9AGAR